MFQDRRSVSMTMISIREILLECETAMLADHQSVLFPIECGWNCESPVRNPLLSVVRRSYSSAIYSFLLSQLSCYPTSKHSSKAVQCRGRLHPDRCVTSRSRSFLSSGNEVHSKCTISRLRLSSDNHRIREFFYVILLHNSANYDEMPRRCIIFAKYNETHLINSHEIRYCPSRTWEETRKKIIASRLIFQTLIHSDLNNWLMPDWNFIESPCSWNFFSRSLRRLSYYSWSFSLNLALIMRFPA